MKRILAIILSAMLVFTFIPVVTLGVSAETVTVDNETDLATYLNNGTADTITFGGDITVTSTIYMSKLFTDTIDTAGFKFIFSPVDETVPCMIQLANSGSNMWNLALDIKNSAATATEFVNNSDGKPLFINYTQNNNQNANRLNIRSGEFNGDIYVKRGLQLGWEGTATYPIINGDVICEEGNGIVYLNEGVINGNVTCMSFQAVKKGHASAKKEVNGDITATTGDVQFNADRNATVVGNITAATKITLAGITQSGGNIIAGTSALVKNYGTASYQLTNISGNLTTGTELICISGTLQGNVSCGGGIIYTGAFGGTISSTDELIVTGANFLVDPATIDNTLIKGTTMFDEATSTYTVAGYAPLEVNGEYYATLATAQTAAQPGDTINFVDDYYTVPANGSLLSLSKDNITIDLNGHILTDLSDIVNTGVATNIVTTSASAKITKFTITSTGGQAKITCNGSDGANQNPFQFNHFNNTAACEITLENFDFMYTGGFGNNRTLMMFSGTSTLDNVVTLNNVTTDNNSISNVGGTGCNGIKCSINATYSFNDCNLYCDRTTVECLNGTSTYNFTRTNVDAGKGRAIYITGAGATVNFKDCNMSISRKQTDQQPRLISTSKNTIRPQITIDNSTFTTVSSATMTGCESTTNYVGADVTITNSRFINNGTGKIIEPTTGDIYNISNTTFETKAKDNAGSCLNMANTAQATLTNTSIKYADSVTASSYPVLLAGTATLALNDCAIAGGRYALKAASTNAISVAGLTLNKNNTNYAFAVDATTAGVITLADGYKYYSDATMETEITDFIWNTTKTYSDVYILNPTTDCVVTVDSISNIAKVGQEYTLPKATTIEGKYFAGFSDGTQLYKAQETITPTENISLTSMGIEATMITGASMRYNNPSGIRFMTMYSKADVDALAAISGGAVDGRITLFNKEGSTKTLQTNAGGWFQEDDNYYYVAGSVASVKVASANSLFTGTGRLTLTNGTEITVTDPQSRSISYIANAVTKSPEYATLDSAKKSIVDTWAALYIAD